LLQYRYSQRRFFVCTQSKQITDITMENKEEVNVTNREPTIGDIFSYMQANMATKQDVAVLDAAVESLERSWNLPKVPVSEPVVTSENSFGKPVEFAEPETAVGTPLEPAVQLPEQALGCSADNSCAVLPKPEAFECFGDVLDCPVEQLAESSDSVVSAELLTSSGEVSTNISHGSLPDDQLKSTGDFVESGIVVDCSTVDNSSTFARMVPSCSDAFHWPTNQLQLEQQLEQPKSKDPNSLTMLVPGCAFGKSRSLDSETLLLEMILVYFPGLDLFDTGQLDGEQNKQFDRGRGTPILVC
jgi:hypothetical protein